MVYTYIQLHCAIPSILCNCMLARRKPSQQSAMLPALNSVFCPLAVENPLENATAKIVKDLGDLGALAHWLHKDCAGQV